MTDDDTQDTGWVDPSLVKEMVSCLGRYVSAERAVEASALAMERADDKVLQNPYRSDREQQALEFQLTQAIEASRRATAELSEASEQLEAANDLWNEARRSLRARDVSDLTSAARAASFEPGPYSLSLSRFDPFPEDAIWEIEELIAEYLAVRLGFDGEAGEELATHVRHVGRRMVLTDVSLRDAITLKDELSRLGAVAEVAEGRQSGGSSREPIPERVRNEVWRRDGGVCVDCGSKERLEFDHVIPLSRGGSNTARNLELRCEPCNRRKGARI